MPSIIFWPKIDSFLEEHGTTINFKGVSVKLFQYVEERGYGYATEKFTVWWVKMVRESLL